MTIRHLDDLFRPQSIALIGASDREFSLGSVVLRNIKLGNFPGPVWPVNTRHDLVGGERAWRSVAELPGTPDLAVICTPAASVPGLIAELGSKGCRAAIVMTAGLKQPAPGGGTLEQAMLDAARPHLLRILGPNCIGALVPGVGLNASFAPGNALPGKLAFVTQSGALATAMLDWANAQAVGFSHFISLGDSADVDFGDVLDYLGSDPGTRAILMYIESIKAARKFMSAARAAARNKPVILVKAGRAPEGARAAASHTGALAGSDVVFDAAVRRAGMLRVDTLEALFDAAQTLAHGRAWRGDRLVVVTNGGGAGVLAADALALGGGHLAELSEATRQALDACLPATWSHGNPVDIIGDAPVSRYQDALKVLLAAPECDGLLFMHAPTAIVPASQIAAACLPMLQASGKPVLACWLGGAAVAAARQASAATNVPNYNTPERAAAAWLQLANYASNQQALHQLATSILHRDDAPDLNAARALLEQAHAEGRDWLGDADSQALLNAYGIEGVATVKTGNEDEAVTAAVRIGFPVALKIISPQVIHKSDVGGVALGLADEAALRAAAEGMRQRVLKRLPAATIEGFTVQAMVQRPGALELILGISTDPVFGPVLLLGEGGVSVERRGGHAVALPPLNTLLAEGMLDRSRLRPLLAGFRGSPAADTPALLQTLLKVSQMAADLGRLAELDINPLLVDQHGVLALDARIKINHAPVAESRLAIRPYPAALEERARLNGAAVRLRPIRPDDGQRLKDFYAHASPSDMRLRFFMARREVPHSELARYSQIDYDREMTFIALAEPVEEGAQMLGEVRAVCDPDNTRAEFAIQVASNWQGRGLGSLLLAKMIGYLTARGTAELVGECLPDNPGMARLARKMGFEVTPLPDHGIAQLRLPLRKTPTPASTSTTKDAP